METTQLNAVGVTIIATIKEDGAAVDVSGVSTKQLILRKPDGTIATKTATFTVSGTDGRIQYTSVAGDFDLAGMWGVQGYVVFSGSFDGRSDIQYFQVLANLA